MKDEFKSVYFKYFQPMCRLAKFYCGDAQLAQDIVQQIFTGLWERGIDFKTIDSVEAYLMRSVRNKVITDQSRRNVTTELKEETSQTNTNVIEQIEARETRQRLDSLIARLPEKRQIIFKMSRFDQMTYKQIASSLDISVKTVENQMLSALKFLRSEFFDSKNQ